MQKKLLAVAVAGALGAPAIAFAQAAAGTSTVQIYGTIYAEFDYYNNKTSAASTAASGGPDRVNFDYMRTAGSEIGFKGEESLGGGMAAWFQCSQSADIRGVAPGNGWCTRNSAVGLKGAFGNIFAGKWDTPYKRTYAIGNVSSGESGAFGNAIILNNGSTEPAQLPAGAVATSAGPGRGIYSRREVNTLNYDSPVFAGFQVLGHWQFAAASTNMTTGNTNTKPRTWGLAGQYNAGPFAAGVFYQRNQDQGISAAGGAVTGATMTNNMDDNSWGLAAAYTWGPVKFGGVWKRESYDVPTAAGAGTGTGTQRMSAWHLGVDWNIVGPHGLRVGYTRAGDVKGTCITAVAGTGCAGVIAATGQGYRPGMGFRPDAQGSTSAAMWQAKYVFAFSKRTEMQFGYSRINNSSNAGYNYSDIGGAVTPGRDPSAWVVTMQHKF